MCCRDKNLRKVNCWVQLIRGLHHTLLQNERYVLKDTILKCTFLLFLALDHAVSVKEKLGLENEGVHMQSFLHEAEQPTAATSSWLSYGFAYRSSRSKTLQVGNR